MNEVSQTTAEGGGGGTPGFGNRIEIGRCKTKRPKLSVFVGLSVFACLVKHEGNKNVFLAR